jgi:SAM-dependent methyltransferase
MDVTKQTENQQANLWNGAAGRAWVESQELLERIFKPFEDLLLQAVSANSCRRVLDVGCGAASTTLAVARLPGARGRCVGIDISEPLIEAARARAERESTPATFIHADAQAYQFEPATFDCIISRFGAMFFDSPVRAFQNLRRAATDDGGIRFIAWRSAAENPFMTAAERAAAPLLPSLPVRQHDAAGQFAFADPHRVTNILEQSGWANVEIRPIDVNCTFPESHLVSYVTRLGSVGLLLQDAHDHTRAEVIRTVRAAFDKYVQGAEVHFDAACWLVSAAASHPSVRPNSYSGCVP